MDGARRTSGKGFGLLELVVVTALAGVILLLTMGLLRTGLGTSSRSATQGTVQEEARRTVESVMRELKDSGESSTGWEIGVMPNPYTQYYDTDVNRIRFSRCIGYDAATDLLLWGPAVTYVHEPPSAGGEPGKLMRIENGVQTRVCDHVTAFTVRYVPDERLIIVSLTVEMPDPESRTHTIRADCTERVRLRN